MPTSLLFGKDRPSPPTSPRPLGPRDTPSSKLPRFTRPRFLNPVLPRRWRRLNLNLLTLVLLGLFLLWLFYDLAHLYITIGIYKLTNILFDDGRIPCGTLRKQPVLFVLDTNNVQAVWEINCGLQNHDVRVAWRLAETEDIWQDTSDDVRPVRLDDYHQLYKTVIGPLYATGKYTYTITVSDRDKPFRTPRVLTSHTFSWHPVDTLGKSKTIRIVAIADNQFGLKTFTQITRAIATRHPPPDLLIHAGDAVQNYPSLRQWQTDFYGPLTRYNLGQRAPIIYAHGNHDHDPALEYAYTRHPPDTIASLGDSEESPATAMGTADSHSPSFTHPWFAFSLASGAIRFIVLDSNLDSVTQDAWLREELDSVASTSAHFRIVVVHIPPFLEFWDPVPWFERGESEWGKFVRDRWVPLFEATNVDLVISGHQHNYQRGEKNGVKYAIVGGAGGDLDLERVNDWGIYEGVVGRFHYVVMEFGKEQKRKEVVEKESEQMEEKWRMKWEMWDLKGRRVDEFVMWEKT